MGNSVEQYRAAIGTFYIQCHCVVTRSVIKILNLAYMIEFIMFICTVLKQKCKIMLSRTLEINFFVQFFIFNVLLLSGDIETNPGPSNAHSLDILHLNVRSIRNKIDSLQYLIHDFHILCFTETHVDPSVLDDCI